MTLSKCCDISINDKHVVYFARAMCEINNNDVGRYLVFTGMIQRLHCDWIQWTERRNNKRYKVALIRIQYFSIKTTGKSSRNKLNQNLVFPITSFSCCVRGDYCCPICSAHVKGKCSNLTILRVLFLSETMNSIEEIQDHNGRNSLLNALDIIDDG